MPNPKLKRASQSIYDWCNKRNILYRVVCDESDLKGVMLFKKDRSLMNQLLSDVAPLLQSDGIHLETSKVRGGMIIALSLKALSESRLAALIAEAGEEVETMTFNDKIIDALTKTVAVTVEKAEPSDIELNEGAFLVSALKLVEDQYKLATRGASRANQTSLQRQRVGSGLTFAGPKDSDDPQATTGATQSSKGPPARLENKLAKVFGHVPYKTPRSFARQLNETLQGMATPTGIQPDDLFDKFAQSLAVLGQTMGTGPLQDQLKQQGINWKKSDDGQAVILYVMNASTNAPQAIARISAATLEKPSDFEAQLFNIMDFAKGDAPGTFKQRQQEAQAQEKAARDIAKQMGPQDPNSVTQQLTTMQGQQPQGQQPQGQPAPQVQPQPTQPAPQAAAQQAAAPKPAMV